MIATSAQTTDDSYCYRCLCESRLNLRRMVVQPAVAPIGLRRHSGETDVESDDTTWIFFLDSRVRYPSLAIAGASSLALALSWG